MTERRRPPRRGRGKRPSQATGEASDNPYREDLEGGESSSGVDASVETVAPPEPSAPLDPGPRVEDAERPERPSRGRSPRNARGARTDRRPRSERAEADRGEAGAPPPRGG